jgi:hypothetical protein
LAGESFVAAIPDDPQLIVTPVVDACGEFEDRVIGESEDCVGCVVGHVVLLERVDIHL